MTMSAAMKSIIRAEMRNHSREEPVGLKATLTSLA